MGGRMDDIDVSILKILQQNARISMREISRQVNLSLPATIERHRKLEREGYIEGYATLLDREKLGKYYCCFCLLIMKYGDSHNDEEFLSFVKANPDVLECHRITGSYEYLLKIVTQSPKTLENMLAKLRDKWGVMKSSTFTVLSSIKEQPTPLISEDTTK